MFSETIRETLGGLSGLPFEAARAAEVAAAWLATYWLHSFLLLGGAWLAGRALGHRRLAVQETLWRAALVGGLITATLQVGLGWQPLAGGWSLPAPEAAVAAAGEAPAARATAAASTSVSGEGTALAVQPGATSSATPIPSPPAHTAGAAGAALSMLAPWQAVEPGDPDGVGAAAPSRPTAPAFAPPRWAVPVTVGLWLAGALLLATRLALAHLRLGRRLRGRVAIDRGPLAALVARLTAAAGVGRRVGLSRSAAIPVPIARGVARGEICLPERALAELPAREQEVMVAHELAHLVRRDPAWLLAARLLESVFFLQPLHAVARRRLRDLAEYRCDDWAAAATGRPLSLARCLTEVAGWALAHPRTVLPAPTMAGGGSALGRRVRRLLDRPGDDGPGPRWLPLAAAAALVAVAAVAPGISGPAPAAGQEPDDEAAAIERAMEEDLARERREAEARQRDGRADSDSDDDADSDYDSDAGSDDDADSDYDSDDDAEAERRADEAGDAVVEAFEREMEAFERDMESALEPIEEQFETHMEAFEEVYEREMEAFEEEFERHFEHEFEAMEDDFEALGEAMAMSAGAGGGIDPEFVARMAELGSRIGEQAAVLAESFSGIAAETGAVVGERLGEDFARRAGELAAAAAPDPELMERLGPELERLQAEARRLVAEERLTDADAERLHAQARALAEQMRPDREELERIRESARHLAEELAPAGEELERLRQEHLRAAERWRAEHGDEMRRLHEELARERARLHAEVERLHREHGSELERHRAERDRHREEMRREHEEQRRREEEQRRLEREQRDREREQRRQEEAQEGGGPSLS